MDYTANKTRYDKMLYNRCGKSGLLLPAMSLGMWHNFGSQSVFENSREMVIAAFDRGITHFDLANNYGPEAGTAEETFGKIIKSELAAYRDEIIVSTKAGYYMWPGPYGEWGSRKNLIASLDQSLKRMSVDYVDIFYHHRPDTETPLEETMDALSHIVRSGKALYVGISNYNAEDTKRACEILKGMGVHCLIHQMRYSMLSRENEQVLNVLDAAGVGSIAFSPLAQGLLTGKYISGIPENSRAAGKSVFLKSDSITPGTIEITRRLSMIAVQRNQTLAQMALAWILRGRRVTSVILGASSVAQIDENLAALDNIDFSNYELEVIENILKIK